MDQLTSPPAVPQLTPRAYHRKTVRWYHSHIIDWMMANPSGSLADCAKHVGKKQSTISAITRSDLFQAALAERKRQFANLQDVRISKKLTEVAVKSLDTILDVIEKKKDTIPLETLDKVANGALNKLGYGLESVRPQTNVQVNVANGQPVQVQAPVSQQELEAARDVLKKHQQTIAGATASPDRALTSPQEAAGASPVLEGELLPPERTER